MDESYCVSANLQVQTVRWCPVLWAKTMLHEFEWLIKTVRTTKVSRNAMEQFRGELIVMAPLNLLPNPLLTFLQGRAERS